MYKKAILLNLTFNSSNPSGILTLQQVASLSTKNLALMAKILESKLNPSLNGNLSFLDEEIKEDPIAQLRFDIVKDLYLTKKAEEKAAQDAAANKAHNQRILELIKQKQDESLANKSIEELEKLLK